MGLGGYTQRHHPFAEKNLHNLQNIHRLLPVSNPEDTESVWLMPTQAALITFRTFREFGQRMAAARFFHPNDCPHL